MDSNLSRPLHIVELLSLRGFDSTRPAKFARHWDSGMDFSELVRNGWVETYQCFQNKPVFDDCELIVSFVGDRGTKARFIGVYRVMGRLNGREGKISADCPYKFFWTQPTGISFRK